VAKESEREWTEASRLKEERFSDKQTIVRPDLISPQEAYRLMDTSLEGFFRKREMNLKNFTLLLFSLNSKKQLEESLKVIEKMESLDINPISGTYCILLSTCAKVQNVELAEQLYKKALESFGNNIRLYTSLLSVYVRAHRSDDCIRIFNDMKAQGFEPEVPAYTSMIQVFKYTEQYDKCYEYFDLMLKDKLEVDDTVITLMMQVCSHTYDAEKALKFFNENKPASGFYRTCFPYNALIKALGSRTDYAAKAEAYFDQMINYQIAPDQDSFICLLKATGKTGNIKVAFNALQLMKERNIEMNEYIFAGLIRTYAAACSIPNSNPDVVKEYKKDSWNLFKQADKADLVSSAMVDSLMLVHSKSHDIDTIEGAILPIYEQRNLPMTKYTFETLVDAYDDQMDLPKISKVYDLVCKDFNKLATKNSLNKFLHTFIRLKDAQKIEDVLVYFSEKKMEPESNLMNSLGNSVNLPDSIYALLHRFKNKYGVISSKFVKVKRAVTRGGTDKRDINTILNASRQQIEKRRPGAFKGAFGRNRV